MATMTELEMLPALKAFDTPSVTNVAATYPANPTCLGLYNPWSENWYTDQTIRSMDDMDENGAVKFPARRLAAVLASVQRLQDEENDRQARLRQCASAAGVRALFAGQSCWKR